MSNFKKGVEWASANLKRVDPHYCIIWEDPADLGSPAKVTVPTPEWLALAMHGGILPAVEVYHAVEDTVLPSGEAHNDALWEMHNGPRMGPMTEEQAMEYLVMNVVPRRVWEGSHNRQMFYIVPMSEIPQSRKFRNAWELSS